MKQENPAPDMLSMGPSRLINSKGRAEFSHKFQVHVYGADPWGNLIPGGVGSEGDHQVQFTERETLRPKTDASHEKPPRTRRRAIDIETGAPRRKGPYARSLSKKCRGSRRAEFWNCDDRSVPAQSGLGHKLEGREPLRP